MSYSLVTITAPGSEEARAIGRALVEARLAASVNVLPEVTSFYWWDGALQEGAEALLLAKTRTTLVEAVVAFVGDRHSYVCPCVIATAIEAGNPDYLAWIDAETGTT
jgi:periplasmic divalent cation tolerance protein